MDYTKQPKVRIKATQEIRDVVDISYWQDQGGVWVKDSERKYTFDEVDFITPDHYANIGADRKYTNAKNPDFNADRVSGEELFNEDNYILRRDGKFLEFTEDEVRELASQLPENCGQCELTKSRGGDECAAHDEKPVWATDEGKEKIKSVSHIFDRDTKPDPIDPLDLLYEYGSDKSTEQQIKEATGELARKQREIIERINLLNKHE